MGRQALALLGQLDAACAAAADLEHAVTESFNLHPDAGIITSFPGLGALTGARVLAEIGDDRSRFQDARGLKAYAGAAPDHPRQRQDQIRHPLDPHRFRRHHPKWHDGLRGENRKWDRLARSTPRNIRTRLWSW